VKLSTFVSAQAANNNARHPVGAQPAGASLPPGYAPGLDQNATIPPSSFQAYAVLTQPASNTGTWVVVSGSLVIDGTAHPVLPSNVSVSTLSYTWDSSSAGNPSEHTLSATAQVEFHPSPPGPATQSQTITSLPAPPPASGPYSGFYGDGRAADFVFANVRLKSLKFTGNIALSKDQTTAIPGPEFTWDSSGGQTASNSAAYVQGSSVAFTLALGDPAGAALMGTATMGYTLKLQANPNGIVVATGQPTPSVTLYDNTAASPVAPTAFTGSSASVTASTALGSYVAGYTTTSAPITLFVEFSKVTPAPTWVVVDTCPAFGTKIYALVAKPTDPMKTPWVPVLDYACQWATGATDATSATTALTKAEYDHCTYNGGNFAHTSNPWQDGSETFHLQAMLGDMTGQCNDFADFLACLSNAIGARPLKPQRSVTAAEYANGNYSHFYTKPITAAPEGTASNAAPFPGGWTYHQWTNDGNIFDGCLRFGGTTTPANLSGPALGTTYNQDLVSSYRHTPSTPDWDPQSPFVLTVVN